MARTGAEDGREMIVLVFADCDPAGYQMAVSIGHKLRAFKEAFHPSLRFQVHAPALTVEQVRRFDLPSTPLKETESRASGWRESYGVEQTEIDALATLSPELLREIVEEACSPYYDATLRRAHDRGQGRMAGAGARALDEQIDPELLADIRARAETALENLKEQLDALEGVGDLDLDIEPPELPEADPPEDGPDPLVSSDMPLVEAIEALRDRKNYSNGGGE